MTSAPSPDDPLAGGRSDDDNNDDDNNDLSDTGTRILVGMTALALVAGVLTGLVGGAFRWLLIQANHIRLDVVAWSHDLSGVG